MRKLWLERGGARNLVVIFGGWALGPAPFAHLAGESDVLFLDDWRELPRDLGDLPELAPYSERHLLAFSFGVAAAGHWLAQLPQDPFTRKVAVNGTLSPCCADCGIAPAQVEATAEALTAQSLARFAARAGANAPEEPALDALRAELLAVLARGPAPDPAFCTGFDRIWVSRRDRIFPAHATARGWAGRAAEIREIDAPHTPFALWRNWAEILA